MTWLILYDDFGEHQMLDNFLYQWLKVREYSYSVQKLLDHSLYFANYSGVIVLWRWQKADTHQIVLDKVSELCHQILRQHGNNKVRDDFKLYIVLDCGWEAEEESGNKIGLSLSNYSLAKLQRLTGISRNFNYRSFDQKRFAGVDIKEYYQYMNKNGCKYSDSFMI